MDPGKIRAIKEWKSQRIKRNYKVSWDSLISISDLLKILPRLIGNHTINWKERIEMGRTTGRKHFRSLIDKMCKEPILYTIKDNGQLKIEVDRSGYAMGAVLLQKQENQWRTITHMSEHITMQKEITIPEIERC